MQQSHRSASTHETADHDGPPPSASLIELAAYLRGVADATTALSDPPKRAFDERPASAADSASDDGPSSRRTIPYGGDGRHDTLPIGLSGCGSLEELEESAEYEERWTRECASGVHLRARPVEGAWSDPVKERVG